MPVGTNGSPQGIFRTAGATSAPQRMKLERDGGGVGAWMPDRSRVRSSRPVSGAWAAACCVADQLPLATLDLKDFRTSPGTRVAAARAVASRRLRTRGQRVRGARSPGTAGPPARLLGRGKPAAAGALTRGRARMTQPAGVTVCAVFDGPHHFPGVQAGSASTGGTASGSLPGLASPAGLCPVLAAAVLLARVRRPVACCALAGCWVWPGQAADHPRVMPAFGL